MQQTTFLHMAGDDTLTWRCEPIVGGQFKIQTGKWYSPHGDESVFIADGTTIFMSAQQLEALLNAIDFHVADSIRSQVSGQEDK